MSCASLQLMWKMTHVWLCNGNEQYIICEEILYYFCNNDYAGCVQRNCVYTLKLRNRIHYKVIGAFKFTLLL